MTDISIQELTALATTHIADITRIALEHTNEHRALVVYDTESELATVLLNAYKNVLPNARYMDFNAHAKEDIISAFDALAPRDLVVLIQSTDFRLNQFRIRIYLFQKKLKVIDHLHLLRNIPDSWGTYVNALAYDEGWYRGVGRRLKKVLESVSTVTVHSGESTLTISGPLEEPKLNIGDYTGMENIGGTFPIGEVFTEAKDLSTMNGSLMIYAFADASYNVAMHEPFRIDIENGILVGWGENAPSSFTTLVEEVRGHERAIIREVGFGLNRALTRDHYLKDITAFERILGMHFSLGEKHTVYKKDGIKADKTRYHVDLFPVVDSAYAGETLVFNGKTYVV